MLFIAITNNTPTHWALARCIRAVTGMGWKYINN
jgi:hypothetical protein